jgi:hypothetical protein
MGSLVKTAISPGIADHSGVLASLDLPVPEATVIERRVFEYGKAKWKDLKLDLLGFDWDSVMSVGDADGSAGRFERKFMEFIEQFIPSKTFFETKSSHEWLDDGCRRLISAKRAAWGTADFIAKRDACTQGLFEAYNAYVRRIQGKLSRLKQSSREWWRLSKSLMALGSSSSAIPHLKSADGWAKSASEKATLLAETFQAKAALDDPVVNEHHGQIFRNENEQNDGFIPIRRRYVRKVLKGLDEHSGTGPDRIAARVLRNCRLELEVPITMLARIVFNQGDRKSVV